MTDARATPTTDTPRVVRVTYTIYVLQDEQPLLEQDFQDFFQGAEAHLLRDPIEEVVLDPTEVPDWVRDAYAQYDQGQDTSTYHCPTCGRDYDDATPDEIAQWKATGFCSQYCRDDNASAEPA